MRIGELSQITGVSIASIRLYEREGLISPASRTQGKFREFTPEQKERLNFIKRIRNLGFSLDDVKALLALSETEPSSRSELLARIHSEIVARKQDLERLEHFLHRGTQRIISSEEIDGVFRL